MIHRLAAELPTMWAAVLPIYGAPLQGQINVPAALSRVSILRVRQLLFFLGGGAVVAFSGLSRAAADSLS